MPDPQARAAEALLDWWDVCGVDVGDARAALRAATRARAVSGDSAAAPDAASARTRPARKPPQARPGVADARAAAAASHDLTALRAAIAAFDGCDLKKTARNTVFCDGAESADIMLVGEAPGRDEDEQGKPFVGRSGQLLDKMFAAIGFARSSNLFISNVIFWRPPGNREPTPAEVGQCQPFIERAIALKSPKILVFVGGVAAKAMLGGEAGVMKLRGRKLEYKPREGPSVNAMVMLHPAYLLRRPQEKRLAWNDLLLLEAWAEDLGVARGQRF